jgi:hypothetical protein
VQDRLWQLWRVQGLQRSVIRTVDRACRAAGLWQADIIAIAERATAVV